MLFLQEPKSYHTSFKGEVSRQFGVVSKTPKRFFFIDKNLKVLFKFDVNYHSSVLRLLMSVSGHRWTGLEWTAT